jgi:Protein of unknown function (DUF3558)
MRVSRFVSAVALVTTVGGCAVSRVGGAFPGDADPRAGGATPTTAPPSSTAPLLPPRPRELDISDVNPCTDVLTRDQLHQLAYDLGYQRSPIAGKSAISGGPTCTYGSASPFDQPSRKIGSVIGVSTSEGAEAWLTDPHRKAAADLHRLAMIAGFPALVLPHPDIADFCAVVVDVHDGQYLEIYSSPDGGEEGTSPDPYCSEAQRVSGIVLQNLMARR